MISGNLELKDIVAGAVRSGKSFAVWRNQDSSELTAIVSASGTVNYDKTPLETGAAGFVVSPFRNHGRHREIKISADVVFKQVAGENFFTINSATSEGAKLSNLGKNLSNAFSGDSIEPYLPIPGESDKAAYSDKYRSIVDKAVSEIKKGTFQKVVPSRYVDVAYPDGWNFVSAFEKLCSYYPGAFVYVFGIPGIGTWMGATPELLISVKGNKWFKTVSLAGTQKMPSSGELSRVGWTQKEIEEQALVSRYIINCFKKIRVREYEEMGPKTARAGNLAHLKTEFLVDMEAVNFPQLGTVMLELLHPTSAICGMPLEPALSFLESNEGYEREYFTGYLGPVNIDQSTELFVNLRSMKLMTGKARLFAGAGVTADSNPDEEWEETELKFQTMKRLFEQA